MTTLIKLGGSLITDKREAKSFRRDVTRDIARQLSLVRAVAKERRLIVGHGSGSFGHVEAQRYNTIEGVVSDEDRLGFVRVGAVAAELSQYVLKEFLSFDLPVMRLQPSSTVVSRKRQITLMDTNILSLALNKGLIPLIHGDIAIDEDIGGTIISTEALFAYLAAPMKAREIILLGDVDGVLDREGAVIPLITPATMPDISPMLSGSSGVDVTGGMLQKVEEMVNLVGASPAVSVIIANGARDDILLDLLIRRREIGTRISAD